MIEKDKLRFLVLEARLDWAMAENERDCLLRAGDLLPEQLELYSILEKPLFPDLEKSFHAVIIGGTGDYSVVHDRPAFFQPLLDYVKYLTDKGFPILGLCYGHQILAQALGGKVEELPHEKSETGTYLMTLTEEGRKDPVFDGIASSFTAQEGHHDAVTEMPPEFIRLAESENCRCQAMRHTSKPIYAFQFHPELTREDLLTRMHAYAHVYATDPGAMERFNRIIKRTYTEPIIRNYIDKIIIPHRS